MDDIRLPMLRGTMEDISQETETSSQTESVPGEEGTSSQNSRAVYEAEAKIKLDYSQLNDDLQDVSCLTLASLRFG